MRPGFDVVMLQRLTEGSYEHVIARVEEAVQAGSASMFGGPVQVSLAGTYPGRCLVLAEDGRARRVWWEQSDAGVIFITRSEPVVLEMKTAQECVRESVHRAVGAFLEGRIEEARSLLEEAVVVTEPEAKSLAEDSVLGLVTTTLSAPRPWRDLLQEQRDRIEAVLGTKVVAVLRETALEQKFGVLYSSLGEEDQTGFRDLVHADTTTLKARITSLSRVTEAYYGAVCPLLEHVELRSLPEVQTYRLFSEDLISSLRLLQTSITEAQERLHSVAGLGALYDLVAENLFDYEVGAAFVAAMKQHLVEQLGSAPAVPVA